MSDVQQAADVEGSETDKSTTSPKTRRWPHYLFGAILLASVLGQIWLWFIWDPPFGRSIQNLVTYALGLLLFILLLIWIGFFSPISKKARWGTVLILLLPAAGYAATIHKIEFTGDMDMLIRHRWEPTQQELIEAHKAKSNAKASEVTTESLILARPEDMASYRGANSDGVVTGPKLSQDWESNPPEANWRQPCGGGYSQFAIVVPFAVTLEQRGEHESVVCYDTETGAERWVHKIPGRFSEAMGGPGPRATPTIIDEEVYAIGANGDLVKLSLRDGEKAWQVNILKRHSRPNTMWGVTSSPFVYGDVVIVNPGGVDGDGIAAYGRAGGELVWARDGIDKKTEESESRNRMGYCTPMLATIHGVQQLLMFDGTGLRSYVPETGELLWEYKHKNDPAVNVGQPLVFDDGRVFISCSYDVGCAMVQVKREGGSDWSTETLWANKNLRCKFTSPVLHDGYIYGLDEGILVCLDPQSGKRKWKRGRYGHGQILLTNGQLLIAAEDGRIVLGNPSPTEKWEEITSFQALEDQKNWNAPALVDGNVYVRNHLEMAMYNLCSPSSQSTSEE